MLPSRSPWEDLTPNQIQEMKTISIIGVGLIGGSIGRALRKTKTWKGDRLRVIGVGRHIEKLKLAKRLGAVDEWTTDFADGTKDADIIFVATPIDKIVPIIKRISPHLKDKAIVTDVGSVKNSLVNDAEKVHKFFVGSHPLAGSEKTSVRYSCPDLFKGANVVITPTKFSDKNAIKTIKNLWEFIGAKVLFMSPEKHDKLIAYTSHLPHILSASLINTVSNLNKKDKRVNKLLAGSFRDITRISDSDPSGWSVICFSNRQQLSKSIKSFIKTLQGIEKDIVSIKKLYRFFLQSKHNRWQLLESNQKKTFINH